MLTGPRCFHSASVTLYLDSAFVLLAAGLLLLLLLRVAAAVGVAPSAAVLDSTTATTFSAADAAADDDVPEALHLAMHRARLLLLQGRAWS